MHLSQMKLVSIIIVSVVLLCVALFLLREPILQTIGDFLIVQDDIYPGDVIHVISGPDDRIDYAIQLYKQGYAKQIFFTGSCRYGMTRLTYAEYGQQRAIEHGVPPQATAIDDSLITSTYSEAVKLKEFMEHSQTPIHSVNVVSDPYHMRRVRWTYRRVLGDQVSIQMAPVPLELSVYQRRWWTDEASRQYVMNEYLKIAYYYARYKFGWGPLGEWLASLDNG